MRRGIASLIGCGLVVIASSPVSAQAYAAPKTPWGDPDLQAIWSGDSAFGIPLQRPPQLGTKAELTDAEFAEKVQRDAVSGADARRTPPGNAVLASTELTIVERITRVEADLLRYDATVSDPKTYTKPYTVSIPFTSPPGYQVLPYECDEGNLAILQGLGVERAEDRAVEEDRQKGIIRARRPIQGGLTVGGQPIPESGPPASQP